MSAFRPSSRPAWAAVKPRPRRPSTCCTTCGVSTWGERVPGFSKKPSAPRSRNSLTLRLTLIGVTPKAATTSTCLTSPLTTIWLVTKRNDLTSSSS